VIEYEDGCLLGHCARRLCRSIFLGHQADVDVRSIIIIFHHEFRPEWPISVSAVIFLSLSSRLFCVRLESNIISLYQVTSLTISSPVVGLLPLATGQDFNRISSVNGGMVIPP
jgi:hypothetical protein